jgi:hypothetical protein
MRRLVGTPVVVLDAKAQTRSDFDWEYVVLSLGLQGMPARFLLARAVWCEPRRKS